MKDKSTVKVFWSDLVFPALNLFNCPSWLKFNSSNSQKDEKEKDERIHSPEQR